MSLKRLEKRRRRRKEKGIKPERNRFLTNTKYKIILVYIFIYTSSITRYKHTIYIYLSILLYYHINNYRYK